jgi:hypothetical protein
LQTYPSEYAVWYLVVLGLQVEPSVPISHFKVLPVYEIVFTEVDLPRIPKVIPDIPSTLNRKPETPRIPERPNTPRVPMPHWMPDRMQNFLERWLI